MRVLIFRHVPFEGAGRIEALLRARNIDFEYADLYAEGTAVPNTGSCDGLIFLGGPMSVNDDLHYLRVEEQFIRDAVAARVPVLGICLGAQLVARAMGAAVRRNPVSEIGWFDLRFTEAAQSDPLFAGLDRESVFHWHGETFDLPEGAELLASSDLCRNQAFRLGDRVWGLQFHLEVTPEMIADWCVQDENCGDVRELAAPIDPHRNAARLAVLGDRVFGEWCDLLLPAPSTK
jgi:GMP synthase-like glutamine amidotransferase